MLTMCNHGYKFNAKTQHEISLSRLKCTVMMIVVNGQLTRNKSKRIFIYTFYQFQANLKVGKYHSRPMQF